MNRMAFLCLGLALAAQPAAAQEGISAPGGLIRVLDKLTGKVADLDISRGQAANLGRLTLLLDDCRYPAENPAADAEAHLTIVDAQTQGPVFAGWMIASSPALSALDHPRYDVWVLRCDYPDAEAPPVAEQEADTGEDAPADPATDEGTGE